MKKDVLFITLTICLLILGAAFFKWFIIVIITPFLILPFIAVAGIIFLFYFISSIVYMWEYRKRHRYAAVPLIINAAVLLLVVFVPFTRLWLKWNFIHYRAKRERIVKQVLAGELQPNVEYNSHLIELDFSFPAVSLGGNQIVVEEHEGKKYILFYTFRGILDNYAGFLYTPDGGDPVQYSDLDEPDSTEIVPFAENCYWVSHH